MQKLIFQLNLIAGNSLDESIKVALHRPQCSLIDCAEGEHNGDAPRLSRRTSICLHAGRQELQVLSVGVAVSCERVKEIEM